MARTTQSLVAAAFYLIRSRDVELAEDFLHRCPKDIKTIRELNAFFHQTLARYEQDTFNIRMCLLDTLDFDEWSIAFLSDVLPFLSRNRFPANTSQRICSYYSDLQTLATSFNTQTA